MVPTGGNIFSSFSTAPTNSMLGSLWRHNIQPYSKTTLRGQMGAEPNLRYVAAHEDHAYVTFATSGQTSPLYPCHIRELDERINYVYNAFGLQLDSPLTEMFNFYLNQMRADGIIAKTWERY